MKITVEQVDYIAKLSKLKLDEEQKRKMAEEFQSILTHFETIDKLDLSDVTADSWTEATESVLRKDTVVVFEDKKKLFQNNKSMQDTAIIVPKILE